MDSNLVIQLCTTRLCDIKRIINMQKVVVRPTSTHPQFFWCNFNVKNDKNMFKLRQTAHKIFVRPLCRTNFFWSGPTFDGSRSWSHNLKCRTTHVTPTVHTTTTRFMSQNHVVPSCTTNFLSVWTHLNGLLMNRLVAGFIMHWKEKVHIRVECCKKYQLLVMLNGAPSPEETPEVLLKIHLRILFSPEENNKIRTTKNFLIFFFYYYLFYHKLGLNIFVQHNFFWKSAIFWGNCKRLLWGAFDHFLGKGEELHQKLI